MKTYHNPAQSEWSAIGARPTLALSTLSEIVEPIIEAVARSGDAALEELTLRFDGVALSSFLATEDEIATEAQQVPSVLQDAIALAAKSIRQFHSAQREEVVEIETYPGLRCWRKASAIERVGLYIPGGSAPLFSSLLMLAIPALVAGCKEIVVCTPPTAGGRVPAALAYVAQLLGLTQIYKVGGAQAIAAMASGASCIPRVDKIFGPGNQYVAAAKQLVSWRYGCAIDLPAGPTELLVVADNTAPAAFVAADLLSQAEHGPDSQVVLVTTSKELLTAVQRELDLQILDLARGDIARQALSQSCAVVVDTLAQAMAFSNCYAPEHLVLAVEDASEAALQVTSAGSVFLGHYTPESLGDYASGTNHTLPTNGAARSYSGVSLDSFVKKITFQHATAQGLSGIGPSVEAMALAEGLGGHALAVSRRTTAMKQTAAKQAAEEQTMEQGDV